MNKLWKNKLLRWVIVLTVILIVVRISYPFVLNILADRLIVQDKLEKADVIVVLGGDANGERVDEGVALYKKGYAKYILMSGGPLAWKLTYAEWMKKQAMQSGVSERVVLLQDKSLSTIDDAKFSLPILKERQVRSIILVTSPTHTRRAKSVFKKIFCPEGIKIIVWPVQKSEFNPKGWWTRHEDTGLVVWEYVSSVLYFIKGY